MALFKSCLIAILAFYVSFLFSDEALEHKGNAYSYCLRCLNKEEKRLGQDKNSFYDQLKYARKVYNVLLDFLNTADEKKFATQMRKLKPYIKKLEDTSNRLFFKVYPDKFCDRHRVNHEGKDTYLYLNIFHRFNYHLTEKERNEAFKEEVEHLKGIQLLPKERLTKNLSQKLVSGQSYCFIVNLMNEAYLSYEQLYRLVEGKGKKILIGPNHTLLAGNNPVLAAGVLSYYKVHGKELYFLSCSSGHFHPKPDSLIHMKNCMIKQGIPEEAIILYSLKYDTILFHSYKS